MKVGVRKPSVKKSIKARTTGKLKRQVKKTVNPLYNKKGMGYINNPKKAVYNKVYNKTTVGVSDIARVALDNHNTDNNYSDPPKKEYSSKSYKVMGIIAIVVAIIVILFGLILFSMGGFIFVIGGGFLLFLGISYVKKSKKL